jgi:hypothetical protein
MEMRMGRVGRTGSGGSSGRRSCYMGKQGGAGEGEADNLQGEGTGGRDE